MCALGTEAAIGHTRFAHVLSPSPQIWFLQLRRPFPLTGVLPEPTGIPRIPEFLQRIVSARSIILERTGAYAFPLTAIDDGTIIFPHVDVWIHACTIQEVHCKTQCADIYSHTSGVPSHMITLSNGAAVFLWNVGW